MRELDEKKCKFCWGKRFYTVLIGGIYHSGDFAYDGPYFQAPVIRAIACPKCNRSNHRKIVGVRKTIYS